MCMNRKECETNACGYMVLDTVACKRRLQRAADSLQRIYAGGKIGNIFKQQHKLVASPTRKRVFDTQVAFQTFSDVVQDMVTDRMTIAIVDGLELVQVNERQRQPGAIPAGPGNSLADAVVEGCACRQSGQVVTPRSRQDKGKRKGFAEEDIPFIPEYAAPVPGLGPTGKGRARGNPQAFISRFGHGLFGTARPAHFLQAFGAKPEHSVLQFGRKGNDEQARSNIGELCRRRVKRRQLIGLEGVGRRLRAQPGEETVDFLGRGRLAKRQNVAAVDQQDSGSLHQAKHFIEHFLDQNLIRLLVGEAAHDPGKQTSKTRTNDLLVPRLERGKPHRNQAAEQIQRLIDPLAKKVRLLAVAGDQPPKAAVHEQRQG